MTDGDKEILLRLARERITAELETRAPVFPDRTPNLEAQAGAFVTLRIPGRVPELRGCIGRIEATESVYDTVRSVAFLAAFRDPRFPQLEREELDQVAIEVSVLTRPEQVTAPEEIVPGRHGLIISNERHSGLLLPQVAAERGWDRQTFLEQTCRKAGLPTDAWRDPQTRIETFEAIVFDETMRGV